MFAQLAVVLAIVASVSARPAAANDCNSGSVQCCNQVQSAKSVDFQKILGSDLYELLPGLLEGTNTPIGLTCTPIVAALSGGPQCNQQTVCCDNGHFSGLISINCISFNGGSSALGVL